MEFFSRRLVRATTQTGRPDFFRHQFRQGQKIFSAGSARVVCPPRRRDRRRVCLVETEAARLIGQELNRRRLPLILALIETEKSLSSAVENLPSCARFNSSKI